MKGALFTSTLLCVSSAVLILLILIAGLNKSILVDWFFLKTSTVGLEVKSRLADSTFLQDLSSLTGTDLVGSDATAASLGLSDEYTVSLFSSCGHGSKGDSETKCDSSKFGYHFNPIEDLKLDNTGLEGSFSSNFLPSISYGGAAKGIAIGFIFAGILTAATQALNIISCCAPRLIFASIITSILATIFQLASSAAAIAIFTNIKRNFNSELESSGIKTSLGRNLFISSWLAFGLMFANSILLVIYHRQSKQTRHRSAARRSMNDHGSSGKLDGGFAPPKRTKTLQLLKNRIAGFGGRHKYAQVEKQTGVRSITVTDHDADRDVLVRNGFGGGEDEHDHERDELVRGSTRGIPMQAFEKPAGTKVVETGYEPFRHT